MWALVKHFEDMGRKLDEVLAPYQTLTSRERARWADVVKVRAKAAQLVSGEYYSRCADDSLPAFAAMCEHSNLWLTRLVVADSSVSRQSRPSPEVPPKGRECLGR